MQLEVQGRYRVHVLYISPRVVHASFMHPMHFMSGAPATKKVKKARKKANASAPFRGSPSKIQGPSQDALSLRENDMRRTHPLIPNSPTLDAPPEPFSSRGTRCVLALWSPHHRLRNQRAFFC